MIRRRDALGLWRVLRVLRPHLDGDRRWLVAGLSLALLAVLLQIAQPWPLKWILDLWSRTPASAGVGRWIAEQPTAGVPILIGVYLAFAVGAAVANYGHTLVLYGLGNRILFRYRAALFTHVLQQPLAFHESREVGELLTRIVYDTSRLRRGLNAILTRVVKTLVLFLGTTAALMWVHPGLGGLMAAGGTVALVTMRRRGRRIARAARRQRRREGSLATHVANELMSIRERQTFGPGAGAPKFTRRNVKSLKQEQKVRRLASGLTMRVEWIQAVSVAAALGIGSWAVAQGALTPGDLVVFLSYAVALRTPFVQFATQTARIGRTRACGERLVKLSERSITIQNAPDAVEAPPFTGAIVLTDVSLRSPARRRTGRKWTLRNVELSLPAGKRIAVVGRNGAGKSTLLRLVLRLADPRTGTVSIDGYDVRQLTLESLRGQMSVVFQDSVLSGLSVRENIALGVPHADPADVEKAATAVGAHRFIQRLPAGYDTIVRRGGRLYSGGERQRLALARAMLRQGRIWLLDEPTNGLDHAMELDIVNLLLASTEGRTTLWVTHDPTLVPRMDWVVALHKGRVTFAGPTEAYAEYTALRRSTHAPSTREQIAS